MRWLKARTFPDASVTDLTVPAPLDARGAEAGVRDAQKIEPQRPRRAALQVDARVRQHERREDRIAAVAPDRLVGEDDRVQVPAHLRVSEVRVAQREETFRAGFEAVEDVAKVFLSALDLRDHERLVRSIRALEREEVGKRRAPDAALACRAPWRAR